MNEDLDPKNTTDIFRYCLVVAVEATLVILILFFLITLAFYAIQHGF